MATVAEFFSELQGKVDPTKIAGMNATYQFDITGDQGGTWHVKLADGAASVVEGPAENPSITLNATDQNWLEHRLRQVERPDGVPDGQAEDQGRHGPCHETAERIRSRKVTRVRFFVGRDACASRPLFLHGLQRARIRLRVRGRLRLRDAQFEFYTFCVLADVLRVCRVAGALRVLGKKRRRASSFDTRSHFHNIGWI